MNKFLINRTIFFSISALFALVVGFASMHQLVRSAYDSYWTAIERVQTVDFNLLASTSIGTVSEIIRLGDTEKAKEFVSSNYCLFRIQIDRCEDPDCHSRVAIADNAMKDQARCTALQDAKESTLEIPVFKNTTSFATVSFDHAYSEIPKVSVERGEQIGFLTLSRGSSIPFDADIQSFFTQWMRGEANASRHQIYKTAVYVSILLGILTFAFLFIIRQFYLSYLKRRIITNKLIKVMDQRIQRLGR